MTIIFWFFFVTFINPQVIGVNVDKFKKYYLNNLSSTKSSVAQDKIDDSRNILTYDDIRNIAITSVVIANADDSTTEAQNQASGDNTYLIVTRVQQKGEFILFKADSEEHRSGNWDKTNISIYGAFNSKRTGKKKAESTYNELYSKAVAEHKPASVLTCLDDAYETCVSQLNGVQTSYKEAIFLNYQTYKDVSNISRDNFIAVEDEIEELSTTYGPRMDNCDSELCVQIIYKEAINTYNQLIKTINDNNENVELSFGQFLKSNDDSEIVFNKNTEDALNVAFINMENCLNIAKNEEHRKKNMENL